MQHGGRINRGALLDIFHDNMEKNYWCVSNAVTGHSLLLPVRAWCGRLASPVKSVQGASTSVCRTFNEELKNGGVHAYTHAKAVQRAGHKKLSGTVLFAALRGFLA